MSDHSINFTFQDTLVFTAQDLQHPTFVIGVLSRINHHDFEIFAFLNLCSTFFGLIIFWPIISMFRSKSHHSKGISITAIRFAVFETLSY